MLRTFRVLLLLTGLTLHAQQPVTPDSNKLYSVQGTVINGQTGAPLPHALVQVYGPAKHAALTDAEGRFSFEGFHQGPVTISVKKPGYFYPGSRGMSLINIMSGKQPDAIELKLLPEAVIFGQVTDDEGEPLEGVAVEALRMNYVQGQRHLAHAINPARTDEDGNFRIGGLHSGRYYLRIKAGQAARRILGAQSKARAEAYPALVYYPAARDFAAASTLDLAAGQKLQISFSIKLAPAFKVSGVVSGLGAYKQVIPPMIVDESGMPLFVINSWDQQSGVFEFPMVPAGTYSLRIGALNEANHFSSRLETITVDRDVANLHLAFSPGVTIPVLLRRELNASNGNSNGSSGAEENANPGMIAATVSLESSTFGNQFNAELGQETDSSALAVHAVMPGKYRVHVAPNINAYVASVRSGGIELLHNNLVVTDGGNVAPIEIVLRDDGGAIKVRVQSTDTSDNPRILLIPESAPILLPTISGISTDLDQEFGNLAPGNYKVLAFDSIEGLEYENPEALEKYSIRAVQVTVSAHSTTPVTVDLIRTGE
jgi:hypothetical protein